MALITIRIERPIRPAGSAPAVRGRRRALLAVAGLGAAYALVGGIAAAAPGVQPNSSTVTSIPAHTLLSNVSIAANKTNSPVASGGATTVPTDATHVQFSVTVSKDTRAGTLTAYPAGNPAGGSGDSLTWGALQTVSGTLTEAVGLKNEVTFVNNSASAVTVLVKITGYGTWVDATDITPTGGTAGQVLTNTGNGAVWQTMGQGYATSLQSSIPISSAVTTVATLVVPAGSYSVSFSTSISGSAADFAQCYLFGPEGESLGAPFTGWSSTFPYTEVVGGGLISTSGGTITVQCHDGGTAASLNYTHLIALQLGAANGAVNNAVPRSSGLQLHN
jgi:hypothetical protein